MKILKRFLALTVFLSIAFGAVYFYWFSPKYVVPILMYHRFGYEDSSLFVTPENFERQMAYIKNEGYEVISLDELVKGIESKRSFNHKTVVLTIDDGYRDNYICAYPVLKKYGFSAVIFIISSYIGNDENFMTWEQIKTMRENDISFGGHTKNQVYLPDIEKKVILWDEIAGCKRAIQNRIGGRINYFCYPTGGFTEEIKEIVRISGYKGACTTNRGFAQSNKDLYELKRIKVTNSDTNKPLSFRAKLSGYYNLFRSKKSGN
ncbi:MAG: polysaccharide deacetylase family protein [Candidatus Ratteibacteria bacterium]|nr:polysaccharide deacetylase family protein [Candidatus Ratteibacteria bacterium]